MGCFAALNSDARVTITPTPFSHWPALQCTSPDHSTCPASATGAEATWEPCLCGPRRGAGCERPGAPGLIGGRRGGRGAHEPRRQRHRCAWRPASRRAGRLGGRAAGQLAPCQRLSYGGALGRCGARQRALRRRWALVPQGVGGHAAMRRAPRTPVRAAWVRAVCASARAMRAAACAYAASCPASWRRHSRVPAAGVPACVSAACRAGACGEALVVLLSYRDLAVWRAVGRSGELLCVWTLFGRWL